MKRIFLLAVIVTSLFAATGSAAITGCNQLTYEGNTDLLSGEVFKCTAVADRQTTDQINIQLSADEFEQLTGKQIEGDTATVSISSSITTNKVSYDFRRVQDFQVIREYRGVTEKLGGLFDPPTDEEKGQWALDNCNDFDNDRAVEWISVDDYWTAAEYMYCAANSEQLGRAANIVNADVLVTTDFTVSTPNGETTRTLSNDGTAGGTTVFFGDFAAARLNGGLQTGDTVSQPSNWDVLAAHDNRFNNGWRTISGSRYDTYRDFRANSMINRLSNWASGEISKSQFESSANDRAGEAVAPYLESNSPFANDNIQITDSSLSGGGFEIRLSDLISWPVVDVFIDAVGDLAIEVTAGQPSVADITSSEFPEGENGIVSVTVENVGDGTGGFSTSLACGENFRYGGTSKSTKLNPSESTTLDFAITSTSTSSTSEKISGTCTATVEDTASGATASESVTVTAVQAAECTPGNRIAVVENGQTVIKECSDGLRYEVVETCSSDEQAKQVAGQLQCVDPDDPFSGGLFSVLEQFLTDLQDVFENPLQNPVLLFDILVTIVVGVAVLVFTATTVLDSVPVEEFAGLVPVVGESGLRLGVGIVAGVLAGLLAYSLISSIFVKVLLVVGLIVVGYIRSLLPGMP